ncbi:MAG: hypothetical protein ACRCZF_17455, partial [Gemmataceae bacterium]
MQRLTVLLILISGLLIGCGGRDPVGAPETAALPKSSSGTSQQTVSIPEAAALSKLSTGTHQETAAIPGLGTINYTILIPSDYDGKTKVPLVLALHYGYSGVKPKPYTGRGMIEAFRPGLVGLNAIIVAPDVMSGDWTDIQNEQAAVWLTKSVIKTYTIDEKKVVITGFSLGGEGTWFIGSRHQDLFTGAIPVAAPVAGAKTSWKIPVYV